MNIKFGATQIKLPSNNLNLKKNPSQFFTWFNGGKIIWYKKNPALIIPFDLVKEAKKNNRYERDNQFEKRKYNPENDNAEKRLSVYLKRIRKKKRI